MTRTQKIKTLFYMPGGEDFLSSARLEDARLANDLKDVTEQFRDGLIAAFEFVEAVNRIASTSSVEG